MHALLESNEKGRIGEGARRRGTGCSRRILRHLCKYPAHVNDFSLACGIIMGAVGHGMLPRAPLTNEFSPTATVVVISYMILKKSGKKLQYFYDFFRGLHNEFMIMSASISLQLA